mmetsp:Transcript_67964/g.107781  ORF Transcript_67964/g.107781 Transcript_67964/m.107781 type:complete len:208 (+) Transcript_67964:48-671(+)
MVKRAAEDSVGGTATTALAGSISVEAPTKLGESSPDEALHGTWDSGKGQCKIGKDMITARLYYEESLQEGERLHGWLIMAAKSEADKDKHVWQGSLALLKAGQGPWYGPSFGAAPEVVGEIKVHLCADKSPPGIETQIKVADEDEDWQAPVAFTRLANGGPASTGPVINWTDSKVDPSVATKEISVAEEEKPPEEDKEQGDRKRVRT